MARKDEFVKELETQIQSLKDWYDDLGTDITGHATALEELRDRRRELIGELVARMLPDLSEATIAKAQRRFPTVIDAESVTVLLERAQSTIQKQLDAVRRLTDTCTPEAEDVLKGELASEEPLATSAQNSYEEMTGIDGLERLITAGYGTPSYRQSWLSGQYYRDWKRADEITDQLGLKNWAAVLNQFATRREVAEIMGSKLKQITRDLADIAGNRQRLAELTQALEDVPTGVLDAFRVKLSAELENAEGSLPENIERVDKRIPKEEAALASAREQKQQVSEKITRLQELRAKVVQSRRQDIPDEYVRHVRRENRNKETQRTVYVDHHDDWLTNYLYYSTMMNLFDQSSHRSHVSSGSLGSSGSSYHPQPPRGDHYGS